MEKNNKPVTEEDLLRYQLLHTWVYRYQDGDPEAASVLLNSFREYIQRFVQSIYYGRLQIKDPAMRAFMAYFYKKPHLALNKDGYKRRPELCRELYQMAHGVAARYSQTFELEEMESIGYMVLLKMARLYKSEDPTFHNYINRVFFQHYLNETRAYMNDPCARKTDCWDELFLLDKKTDLHFEEATERVDWYWNRYFYDKSHPSRFQPETPEDPYSSACMDISWVNGRTCREEFRVLTSYQRKLLRQAYHENMSDKEIAQLYGIHRVTLCRKRMDAKKKLGGVYGKNCDTKVYKESLYDSNNDVQKVWEDRGIQNQETGLLSGTPTEFSIQETENATN